MKVGLQHRCGDGYPSGRSLGMRRTKDRVGPGAEKTLMMRKMIQMRMMNQLAKSSRSHHLSRVIDVEPGVVGAGGGALAEVLAVALAPE